MGTIQLPDPLFLSQDIVLKKGDNGVGAVVIGRIPLMLRSDRCVLKGKSEEELAHLGAIFDPALSIMNIAPQ